jgi:hypothetical protein
VVKLYDNGDMARIEGIGDWALVGIHADRVPLCESTSVLRPAEKRAFPKRS